MLHVTPTAILSAVQAPPPDDFPGLSLADLRKLFEAHRAAQEAISGILNRKTTSEGPLFEALDAEEQRHCNAIDRIVKHARAARPACRDERAARASILLSYEGDLFDNSYLALAEAFIAGVEAH